MGICTINCASCQKPFQCFSGSISVGQFCEECKKPKEENHMNNNESKEIDYLNQIIRLQNQIIDLLRVEVDRLKTASIYYPPINPTPIIGPGLTIPHNPFIVQYPDPGITPK